MHASYVWVLIILPVRSQFLNGSREVTGSLGGSLTVQCHYEKRYANYSKYWCRGGGRFCDTVFKTTQVIRERSRDRGSIKDDPVARTLTVTVVRLTQRDAGMYQFGIETWGFDPLFLVTVIVRPAPSTLKPTVQSKTTSSSVHQSTQRASVIIFDSTTEASYEGSFHESIILKFLIPALMVVLVLFLMMAVLFTRAQRTQALNRDSSQGNNNIHVPDMVSDTRPMYDVVKKPKQTGNQNNIIPTMNTVTADDIYEEIKDSPWVSDTSPMYAVVKKPKPTGNQNNIITILNTVTPDDLYEEIKDSSWVLDISPMYAVVKKPKQTEIQNEANPTSTAVTPEECSEEIQDSSWVVPDTSPIYAVVRKPRKAEFQNNAIPALNTVTPDDCCEEIQDTQLECSRRVDASYSTIQCSASDPLQEIYTDVELPQRDSSQECMYSVVKK